MVLSLYGGFGVDKKTNKLLKSDTKLEDCLNVTLNESKEWVSRDGLKEDFAKTGILDSIYINSEEKYFCNTATEYKVINPADGSEFVPHNYSGIAVNPSLISHAEYAETVIFTHEDNPEATLKYDGGSVYKAGLPVPTVTLNSPGTGYDFALFYDYLDAYGNTVFGPIKYASSASSTAGITVNSLKNTGFYEGFLVINTPNPASLVQTLSSANRTLNHITSMSSDYKVGARVSFRTGSTFGGSTGVYINQNTPDSALEFISLRIESMTATSLTFVAEDFGENTLQIISANGVNRNIDFRLRLRIYKKAPSSSVYEKWSGVYEEVDNRTVSALLLSIANTVISGDTLAEIYDFNNSKLRPPQCRYIQAFGDQLVFGSVSGLWDFDNKFIKYNNDDLIMYSDISEGDYVENISEINRQLIGDTYDGFLSGLSRSRDSLIIFKNKSVYALDGILLPGEYNLRKIETNLIGCTSFKSILSTGQFTIFQGNDNIYVTNGFDCKEFGDPIETVIDNSNKIRSVLSVPNKLYMFYNGVRLFTYQYEEREWFIWDGIDASRGLIIDGSGKPIFVSATRFSSLDSSSSVDYGTDNINAYIQTKFYDLKKPALNKILTGLRIYSFGSNGNLSSLVRKDWSDAKDYSTASIASSGEVTIHKHFSPVVGQSISVKISNSGPGRLHISGMELEIEMHQTKDTNVK